MTNHHDEIGGMPSHALRENIWKAFQLLRLPANEKLVVLDFIGRDVCVHTKDQFGFTNLFHTKLPVGWPVKYRRISLYPRDIVALFPRQKDPAKGKNESI